MTVYCFRLFFLFFFVLPEREVNEKQFQFLFKKRNKTFMFFFVKYIFFFRIDFREVVQFIPLLQFNTFIFFFATIISGFNFSLSLFEKFIKYFTSNHNKKMKIFKWFVSKNCISLSSKNLAITKNKTKKLITNQILDEQVIA